MLEFLRANWSDILAHIAQHVWLVFISTAIAIAIALPLGILITRRKRWRGPVLGIANVMQTIPSLALFGFLIPLPFIGGIGPRTASCSAPSPARRWGSSARATTPTIPPGRSRPSRRCSTWTWSGGSATTSSW